MTDTAQPGDAEVLQHGTRSYGGALARDEGAVDHVKLWYQPAHTLGGRSEILSADTATELSAADPARKFVEVRNLGPAVVWLGDSNQVALAAGTDHGGYPLYVGEAKTYDQREYDGPLWGRTAVGAADTDVRVTDPTADR